MVGRPQLRPDCSDSPESCICMPDVERSPCSSCRGNPAHTDHLGAADDATQRADPNCLSWKAGSGETEELVDVGCPCITATCSIGPAASRRSESNCSSLLRVRALPPSWTTPPLSGQYVRVSCAYRRARTGPLRVRWSTSAFAGPAFRLSATLTCAARLRSGRRGPRFKSGQPDSHNARSGRRAVAPPVRRDLRPSLAVGSEHTR